MAVNQFEKPLQHTPQQTYTSQYVPLPFEAMANKVQQDQAAFDGAKNQAAKLSDVMTLNSLPIDDQVVNAKINQIQGGISAAVNDAEGDWRKAGGAISQGASEWKRFAEMELGADITYRIEKRDEYEKALEKSNIGSSWVNMAKTASTVLDAQQGGVRGLGRDLATFEPWENQDWRKGAITMALKKKAGSEKWSYDRDSGNYIITESGKKEILYGSTVEKLAKNHLAANEEFGNMVQTKYGILQTLSGEEGVLDREGNPVSYNDYFNTTLNSTLQGAEGYGYEKTEEGYKLKKTAVGNARDLENYNAESFNLIHSTFAKVPSTGDKFNEVVKAANEGVEGWMSDFYEVSNTPVKGFYSNVVKDSGSGKGWTNMEATANLGLLFSTYFPADQKPDDGVWNTSENNLKFMEALANGDYTYEDYQKVAKTTKNVLGQDEKTFRRYKAAAKDSWMERNNQLSLYDEIFDVLANTTTLLTPAEKSAWKKHTNTIFNPNIPASEKPMFIASREQAGEPSQKQTQLFTETSDAQKEKIALYNVFQKIEKNGKEIVKARTKRYSNATRQYATFTNDLPITKDGKGDAAAWNRFKTNLVDQNPDYWPKVAEFEYLNEEGGTETITMRQLAEQRAISELKSMEGDTGYNKKLIDKTKENLKKIVEEQLLFQQGYAAGNGENLVFGLLTYENGVEKTYTHTLEKTGVESHVYSTLMDVITPETQASFKTVQNNFNAENGVAEKFQIDNGMYIKTPDKIAGDTPLASTMIPGTNTYGGGINAYYGANTNYGNYEMEVNPSYSTINDQYKEALNQNAIDGVVTLDVAETNAYQRDREQTLLDFNSDGKFIYTISDSDGDKQITIDNETDLNDYINGILLLQYVKN